MNAPEAIFVQASAFGPLAADDMGSDVLYESSTTRVLRLHPANGPTVICKQPLGVHALERLRNESRIVARLAGIDGIPQLAPLPHSAGTIALEDCAGVPFAQARAPGELAIGPLLELALQLAQIVAAMHRRGVLHQNINPGHILLCGAQQRPVLIDFQRATTFAEGQPGFTHHRDIAGNLTYLAPEQTGRTGRSVDRRADLYALGATLYELATGRPPFEERDPLRLIHDHLARLPQAPAALRPDLPETLSQIILRLLEKEPEQRYQSADGLVHDLAKLQQTLAQGNTEGAEPMRLCERDFPQRLSPPSRLVGRENEIGVLRQAFEQAMQGRVRVVLVAGAPGVGKTSLINELRPMVTARRGWFVLGKFDQYRRDAPTATVQALRALGRLLLAEPQDELASQRERILEHLGANAGLVCASWPEYSLLLGPQPETAAVDPAQAWTRALLTTVQLLRAIVSPARPVVMVLDDLQWASSTSIRFVEAVLAAADLPGLLLVGAYREAELDATHPLAEAMPRWARADSAPVLLRLDNLPAAELGELLGGMLRLPPSRAAQLALAVGAHTAGNPYDTVELVNALRHDGALVPGPEGWEWDTATVRRYVGQGGVIDLLRARIAQLPPQGRLLLEAMACLGGEVQLSLLQAAVGLSATELEEQLAAPLEDGLMTLERSEDSTLRLRHDRIQQAAYGAMAPQQCRALHLALARRLALHPEFHSAAAQQYLPAAAEIHDADERRSAANLLRKMAAQASAVANFNAAERFQQAAITLLSPDGVQTLDAEALAALEAERHAALYSLGRFEEADQLYKSIESHCTDQLTRVGPACVQVSSLTNRGLPREGVAVGLALLRELGIQVPSPDGFGTEVDRRLPDLYRWAAGASQSDDGQRAEASDARGTAIAALINRLMAPLRLCEPMVRAWLVLESQRLWEAHGPCAKLAACISHAAMVTIAAREDYRTGYQAARHMVGVSQTRGWAEAAQVGYIFALTASHWFDPLENSVALVAQAREGMLRDGNLQGSCFTYYGGITALLDCAPHLDRVAEDVEAGVGFAARTGNGHGSELFRAHRQLLRALRGQTSAPGSFSDAEYDEADRVARLGANPSADATFHLVRCLAALIFRDTAAFARHADDLFALRNYLQSYYAGALVRLVRVLALAEQLKQAPEHARSALLAELDAHRDWLARRAEDAPANFGHLLLWVQAERAWCLDEPWNAARAFDAALQDCEARVRPWHRALITERAGLFHSSHGMNGMGRTLLGQARDLYHAWGADGKVRELERCHGFLGESPLARPDGDAVEADVTTVDTVDTLAILRASQALSSETSLAQLKASVVDLLGSLTGATKVQFVLWDEDAKDWFLSNAAKAGAAPVSVEQGGTRGLLPLSAFRYAERTREPLLVEDATHDDRFAGDPYLRGAERCSLLVVPILNHGASRAMLVLENRLSRGAFTADRLDAVMLITGQLAVSLANAQLYEQLERRVKERTQELQQAQTQLLGAARVAGMAEIATNVLHNVGNVLNSVNISAGLVGTQLRTSKLKGLARAVKLMDEHSHDLGDFLTHDTRGKMMPGYLRDLAQVLEGEHDAMAGELDKLAKSIDHIKEVVATQQSYAGASHVVESLQFEELLDDALRMNAGALTRHKVDVVKHIAVLPALPLDRHRLLQILVNLISNAKHAMSDTSGRSPCITIVAALADAAEGSVLRITVDDNGEGIPPENLTRVFAHGFTTRKNGHGFGLHSCVLAAQEMGGRLSAQSDGLGHGATFTLEIPIGTSKVSQ